MLMSNYLFNGLTAVEVRDRLESVIDYGRQKACAVVSIPRDTLEAAIEVVDVVIRLTAEMDRQKQKIKR